jgi:hypothetical protein
MEIFRLTCLEENMPIAKDSALPLPEVLAEGIGFVAEWAEEVEE